MNTPENNKLNELLPLIYIHIHRTVKQAIREVIAEPHQQENLNAKECADHLRIGIDKLYKMVRYNEIPYHRIGKRKLIFKKSEIQNFIKK